MLHIPKSNQHKAILEFLSSTSNYFLKYIIAKKKQKKKQKERRGENFNYRCHFFAYNLFVTGFFCCGTYWCLEWNPLLQCKDCNVRPSLVHLLKHFNLLSLQICVPHTAVWSGAKCTYYFFLTVDLNNRQLYLVLFSLCKSSTRESFLVCSSFLNDCL